MLIYILNMAISILDFFTKMSWKYCWHNLHKTLFNRQVLIDATVEKTLRKNMSLLQRSCNSVYCNATFFHVDFSILVYKICVYGNDYSWNYFFEDLKLSSMSYKCCWLYFLRYKRLALFDHKQKWNETVTENIFNNSEYNKSQWKAQSEKN